MDVEFPVTASKTGVYGVCEPSDESVKTLISLLYRNHHEFNIFWNHRTYHNHQVHYLLTAYALGADAHQLEVAFNGNASYQRPRLPVDEALVRKLASDRYFAALIGQDTHDNWFNDLTTFFQRICEQQHWQDVVQKYLFSRSEIAEQLLAGLFAGVIHPLIHFGFGVEFQLIPVIAESLAMATCHNKFFAPFFHRCEELAATRGDQKSSAFIDLVNEIRQDPTLYDVEYWDGGDSLNDKILSDAPEKLCRIASSFTVGEDEIEEKTAEMINVNAYITGAAQRPDKKIKLDFFFIHCVNASIFFSVFNQQSWLVPANKARLLEWKVRSDLLTYASRVAPELYAHEIVDYKPEMTGQTWAALIQRTNELTHDDGHIAKLVRALAHGEKVCGPYESDDRTASKFPLKGSGWLQIANMGLDTTKEPRVPDRWMRGAGAAKNWQNVAPRV